MTLGSGQTDMSVSDPNSALCYIELADKSVSGIEEFYNNISNIFTPCC